MIIRQKMIYRDDLKSNPHLLYVFGDNLLRIGMGGQAGEMRGEKNSFGIATKRAPGMMIMDFFRDCEKDKKAINDDLKILAEKLIGFDGIVIPLDGLGSGLAKLNETAPNLFLYLNEQLLNVGK